MVWFLSDAKLAGLFSIAFASFRQAVIEKTMNINMTAQMILTKMASYVQETSKQPDLVMSILDHESFLNKTFDIVSTVYIFDHLILNIFLNVFLFYLF